MSALPAATAAALSFGTASSVFWVLWPPLGACTASALVIFPLLTVMRTWTGPYCVCATVPVSVLEAALWAGADALWEGWEGCADCGGAAAFALSIADWRDFL